MVPRVLWMRNSLKGELIARRIFRIFPSLCAFTYCWSPLVLQYYSRRFISLAVQFAARVLWHGGRECEIASARVPLHVHEEMFVDEHLSCTCVHACTRAYARRRENALSVAPDTDQLQRCNRCLACATMPQQSGNSATFSFPSSPIFLLALLSLHFNRVLCPLRFSHFYLPPLSSFFPLPFYSTSVSGHSPFFFPPLRACIPKRKGATPPLVLRQWGTISRDTGARKSMHASK